MQIIRNLNQIKISLPDLALTIGNFDGVHLGHLQILSEVKKIAKEKKLSSAVLTFEQILPLVQNDLFICFVAFPRLFPLPYLKYDFV